MKIIQKRIYEGQNIYSHKKCIRIDMDLEGYSEIPSKDIPNFNFNLVNIIPELKIIDAELMKKVVLLKD